MMQPIRRLQTQLGTLWASHTTKRVVIVSGTLLGVGVFYWPFISSMLYPPAHMTPEQVSYYDKENYYLAKKTKQLEEEKRQKQLRGKQLLQASSEGDDISKSESS
ncbi:uncharacterized protein LOC101858715 [Aplysia californica]|uniref:Uncharacterized protein LOC101858715 n=1 Tax=Aplysia californica TaxID=6500 RepID=A0ABM0JRE3_APLCA|nr:uncharacterized protein LOC101858715 [Aplysia californica]